MKYFQDSVFTNYHVQIQTTHRSNHYFLPPLLSGGRCFTKFTLPVSLQSFDFFCSDNFNNLIQNQWRVINFCKFFTKASIEGVSQFLIVSYMLAYGKDGRIGEKLEPPQNIVPYHSLHRSFLLRYRSHDFNIEVYNFPISRNLRKMSSISLFKTSKSKPKLWYWVLDQLSESWIPCWGPE